MRKISLAIVFFAAIAANAQQRVFVSAAHGDDTNPCSVTCRAAPSRMRPVSSSQTARLWSRSNNTLEDNTTNGTFTDFFSAK